MLAALMAMLLRRVKIPEGLCVLSDGSWRVGDQVVAHAATLRFFKEHLVCEEGGAFVVDGDRRVQVRLEGPPFEVARLEFSEDAERVTAVLDDGSREDVGDLSLSMNQVTARFECSAREGRARAVLSRTAHNALLDAAEQAEGRFFLRVGRRLIPIRT
jgi:hypothetical protein